ncbi:MAG TPA: tRNA pseudouridine(55) synthase TruB [Candidatus Paenalcaligenes intestinipullorum]|uniref:tRNA pseudouridine synthase B n=1 Tax=Candidatus Paenalcaligenes intestinipullorum TaxID=2838718 RepID=A0A9D2U7D2_9BURK|nr:tRNA pseudouridine(55) synthase TruB [Candidatus Paenalcaligenes intestinipullorum]
MARRQRGRLLDGVLLLDKPEGLSSNHALQRARRAMDARKAGHTGTLDPFATGLLVCCFGRATKISGLLLDADKGYEAVMRFGVETDSGDLTGSPVATNDLPAGGITTEALRLSLEKFKGTIEQIPPMYSALKRDGKPLYEYARQGIELERPPRTVHIHQLDLLENNGVEARIFVACSKGTYIRTLAQDIGRDLGCYAHLVALRRTVLGPFDLADGHSLEQIQSMPEPESTLIGLAELPEALRPANLIVKETL